MQEMKEMKENSVFNNLMPHAMINIILSYTLNYLDNVDIDLLRESIEKVGNDKFELYITGGLYDKLGQVQNFKILTIERNNENGITITTLPMNSKKYRDRIKLNNNTIKLLYKSLLTMHGLKGVIKVEKIGATYVAIVSNVKLSDYTETYYPVHEYMRGELSRHFKISKYKKLSIGIISQKSIL